MYRLHGFCQSGNTFKVAFLLRALGQPWEAVLVDYMRGITRDVRWREAANEMGEVPILEDGGSRRVLQGHAILEQGEPRTPCGPAVGKVNAVVRMPRSSPASTLCHCAAGLRPFRIRHIMVTGRNRDATQ